MFDGKSPEEELFEKIRTRIEEMYVDLPHDGLSVKELQGWMNGYAACHQAVLCILDDMQYGVPLE